MAVTFENKEPLHMVRAKLNSALLNVDGIVNEINETTTENMERAEAAANLAVNRADAAFFSEQNAKSSELSAQGDAALAEQYRDEALDAREGIEEDKADTEADRILAEQARDAALGYRNQSETYKNQAQASATAASGSASTASTQASSAAASAATATTKAGEAATSATTATTKAGEAALSASQANTSATSATASSLSASTSAANANTYASNAANSATTASNKATEASNAATTATNKALEASSSATTATDKALSASLSADAAAQSALNASGYLSAVEDSADTAVAAASSATSSASAASTSEGNALSYANAASGSAAAALSSASAAALSAGSANDAYVATQDLMDQFANFRFLGKVEWWPGDPSMIPAGFLPLNGQLLNRADYPDLWEDVENGVFISVTDELWLSSGSGVVTVAHRAKFSTGDGTTTFRLPDLNGVQPNSLKGLYLRGSQTPQAVEIGRVMGDVIRNITSTNILTGTQSSAYQGFVPNGDANSALYTSAWSGDWNAMRHDVTNVAPLDTRHGNIRFDASRSVPTGPENRPVSAVGTWIMLVNGAPARQFNPETSAGLGSNTFGGLQRFNAGFEWVGVVPQLIQTDVDQGLTTAQKLRAATNLGGVSYASPQTLTSAERILALQNIGGVPYADDLSATITAAQKAIARKNIGLGTPADFAVQSQAVGVSSATSGQHTRYHMDFRLYNGSGSEVWRIIFGSFVKAASSSDSIALTYGFTFLNGGSYIMLNNGDATVDGNIILSPFNVTLSGFSCAARLGGVIYTGIYRGNYSVLGRLS